VGVLAERSQARTLWPLLGIAVLGLVPIYAIGASWLAWQLQTTRLETVVWGGIVQFVPGDVTKAVVAALTARALVNLPLGLPALSRSH
jgi:biotin transporter BioY